MEPLKTTRSNVFSNHLLSYGGLIILHLLLAFFAFTNHFTHPVNTVFTDWGDGMKNNFTLLSYVKSPIGKEGIFKYDLMNYPIGEYVYTTDNTPLFSIPFRWFCHHIYDLSDYTLVIFNFLIIANIILCGLLAFYVFKKLLKNRTIAWLFALILPWTNFQLARVFRGHYNLSLTALCVIALLLFLLWEKYYYHKWKSNLLLAGMILFSYLTFLIHGYYIAIIPVYLSAMLGFLGIYRIFQHDKKGWYVLTSAIILLVATALLAYLTMIGTDGFYQLRPAYANGYDWMEQKTTFSLLFTHYDFHHLFFPVWSTKNANDIEAMCYLGNVGLYTILLLFIISLFSQHFRLRLWAVQKEIFRSPVKGGIIFAGLLLLSMSFGEKYSPLQQQVTFGWPFSTNQSIVWSERTYILLFVIFCLVTAFLFFRHKNRFVTNFPEKQAPKPGKAVLFYCASAAILYVMFGHYHVGHFDNITNPLWTIHKFTRIVEQFRSMVRFAWPFYWSFYVWIGLTLSALYLQLHTRGKLLIVGLILLLGGAETIDFVKEIRRTANHENILSPKNLQDLKNLSIKWDDYQALLPLPYYIVGCESGAYNYTIDDIPEVSQLSYQLSIVSNLPLMAGKLSRTTEPQTKLLMETLISDSLPAAIKQHLNHKPVLIFEDKNFIGDSSISIIPPPGNRPFANRVFWESQLIIKKHGLKPIDSLNNIYFYKWEINP